MTTCISMLAAFIFACSAKIGFFGAAFSSSSLLLDSFPGPVMSITRACFLFPVPSVMSSTTERFLELSILELSIANLGLGLRLERHITHDHEFPCLWSSCFYINLFTHLFKNIQTPAGTQQQMNISCRQLVVARRIHCYRPETTDHRSDRIKQKTGHKNIMSHILYLRQQTTCQIAPR
jgi:hypothetical protein